MNLFLTIAALAGTFVLIGGLAIFLMNIASKLISPLISSRSIGSILSITGIALLSLVHIYIWLSFVGVAIWICHITTAGSVIKTILSVVTAVIAIVLTWTSFNQARDRSKEVLAQAYEAKHVVGISINALISTPAILILSFFPILVLKGWPWINDAISVLTKQ